MRFSLLSEAGSALNAALKRPDEWVVTKYSAKHNPSKTSWWTANGAWFFDMGEPYEKVLGPVERHYLWRKYLKMIRAKTKEMMV